MYLTDTEKCTEDLNVHFINWTSFWQVSASVYMEME